MANINNLRVPTSSEARKNGKKGGIASAKAKKERKALKDELLILLSNDNTQEKISLALIKEALTGNTKAFEVIRDTIGEKPINDIKANVNSDINIKIELSDD